MINLKHRCGFSVLAALVGLALLGIAGWILSQAIVENRQWGFKADRRVQTTQILVDTVSELINQEFSALQSLCESPPSRFSPAPVSGNCVNASGQFNEGVETQVNPAVPRLLEVRRNWTGIPSNSGKVCLELIRCQRLGGGRMIDFTVRAIWKDPSGQRSFLTHQIQARKTRS